MIVIGLCGGSGSGKGTVAKIFADNGIPTIDADSVYRDLTYSDSPLVKNIAEVFGGGILTPEGLLNRKELSSIVFSDKSKLMLLNSLAHPAIIAETERRIDNLRKMGNSAVVFDAPQLFESGFDKKCDVIITVTAPYDTRVKRLSVRDAIPEDSIRKRISSQISDEFLIKNSDYVIENSGNLEELSAEVTRIMKKILK